MPYIDVRLPSNRTRVVAFEKAGGKKIIASGVKISTVLEKAKKAGYENPFIMTVPASNSLHHHFLFPKR